MTDHHPECEDATGAYGGCCTCAAIKRRAAMDNLIAQDADLIEICPDDLVQRLRSTVCQGNLGCHRLVDDDEAADRIEALTAENFKLAAGSCDVEGGKVGDEHGHFYCTLQKKVEAQAAEISKWHTVSRAYLDRIETLRAEIERLNKSAECLAESRRLAVKDLAALEGHMRLEIGQWRVDYDCAIMDVEHLRERIEALTAALEKFDDLIQYQYSGSREAMSAMTEAAQEGARVLGRGTWKEAGQPWLWTYDAHLKGNPNGD